MSPLRVHVLAKREPSVGGRGDIVTALCGRQGFKSIRHCQAEGEYQAMATLGGFRCVAERAFYPGHDACARCKTRWMKGEGIS